MTPRIQSYPSLKGDICTFPGRCVHQYNEAGVFYFSSGKVTDTVAFGGKVIVTDHKDQHLPPNLRVAGKKPFWKINSGSD